MRTYPNIFIIIITLYRQMKRKGNAGESPGEFLHTRSLSALTDSRVPKGADALRLVRAHFTTPSCFRAPHSLSALPPQTLAGAARSPAAGLQPEEIVDLLQSAFLLRRCRCAFLHKLSVAWHSG